MGWFILVFFQTWLKKLLNRLVNHGAVRRSRAFPRLEWLEDRIAPAFFIVRNALDDPDKVIKGSLREAINGVNADKNPGNDLIVFAIKNADVVITIHKKALPAITH